MSEERKTLGDIEVLPGLTKIETLDYHWLLKRSEPRDLRELARLAQLAQKRRAASLAHHAEKPLSAQAAEISVAVPGLDTERVEKIGDLVVRYLEERAPIPRPSKSQKIRRLVGALFTLTSLIPGIRRVSID